MKPWNIAVACLLTVLAGCHELNLRSQSPDKDEAPSPEEFKTTVHTPFLGDYITISGMNLVTLEGVGLVVGLDGTGGDPPDSFRRTALVNEMQRRNIKEWQDVLRSPNTAMVVIRAYLPPLIRKGDTFDVEVRLPEGSNATSLRGGWLLETRLSEQAIIPGHGIKDGHVVAKVDGPILVSSRSGDAASLAGVLQRGRILGRCVSLTERDLTIYLRSDFRSVRNSKRISDAVSERFYGYDRYGLRQPLANAETDQTVGLKIDPVYRNNSGRYLEVIRRIPFNESTVAERVRMQHLKKRLQNPVDAEDTALELEAIGRDAIPILETGLDSTDPEVLFHSASALAYLGNSKGLQILADAARNEPAFRVFALAAMSTVEDVEANMLLRELMNAHTSDSGEVYDSTELRYGAFRALWTLDKTDPFLRGEMMNGGEFYLHVLDTSGPAMLHVTRYDRPELVLFGKDQRFSPPLALRAGNHILVTAAPGSDQITVSKYVPGEPDRRQIVSTRVAEVIRTCAEMGATYPDVVQLIVQADEQHNAPGRLAFDAIPQAGRTYYRKSDNSTDADEKTRVGNSKLNPDLFPRVPEKDEEAGDDRDDDRQAKAAGQASLADARMESDKAKKEKSGLFQVPSWLPKLGD